jgi:hypothetical protein
MDEFTILNFVVVAVALYRKIFDVQCLLIPLSLLYYTELRVTICACSLYIDLASKVFGLGRKKY